MMKDTLTNMLPLEKSVRIENNLKEKLVESGFKKVMNHYSMDRMVDAYKALYESTISERAGKI